MISRSPPFPQDHLDVVEAADLEAGVVVWEVEEVCMEGVDKGAVSRLLVRQTLLRMHQRDPRMRGSLGQITGAVGGVVWLRAKGRMASMAPMPLLV